MNSVKSYITKIGTSLNLILARCLNGAPTGHGLRQIDWSRDRLRHVTLLPSPGDWRPGVGCAQRALFFSVSQPPPRGLVAIFPKRLGIFQPKFYMPITPSHLR